MNIGVQSLSPFSSEQPGDGDVSTGDSGTIPGANVERAESSDKETCSLASSLPPCGLPPEIWAHVLSYLSSYDLLRSVIPVNRFFRSLAYDVGFQDLSDLGDRWWIYDFPASFFQAIPKPKKLRLDDHEDTPYPENLDLSQKFSNLMENIRPGLESLALRDFYFDPSLATIDAWDFPNLKELSIIDGHWVNRRDGEAFGRIITGVASQLQELRIDFQPPDYDFFLKTLDNNTHITRLEICCSATGDFSPTFSATLRSLVFLRLRTSRDSFSSESSVKFRWLFKNFPHLEELELVHMNVDIDNVDFHAPKLKKLMFERCELQTAGALVHGGAVDRRKSFLRPFPNLTHLGVSLELFPLIAGNVSILSNLQGLVVNNEVYAEDECFRALEQGLSKCEKLEELLVDVRNGMKFRTEGGRFQ